MNKNTLKSNFFLVVDFVSFSLALISTYICILHESLLSLVFLTMSLAMFRFTFINSEFMDKIVIKFKNAEFKRRDVDSINRKINEIIAKTVEESKSEVEKKFILRLLFFGLMYILLNLSNNDIVIALILTILIGYYYNRSVIASENKRKIREIIYKTAT